MKYNKAYEEICDKYHVSDYGRVAIQQFFQTQHEAEIDMLRKVGAKAIQDLEERNRFLTAFDDCRKKQVKRKDI